MNSSNTVSDAEAEMMGGAILGIYRVVVSIESLYRKPIDSGIKDHSLFQEVERLFGKYKHNFEGPEFALFTAAHIATHTGEAVTFVPEMGKEDKQSPDLCVTDLCYLECKDLAPGSVEGISATMSERLEDAGNQLAAARQRDPSLLSGVALDLPLRLFQPDKSGFCSAAQNAHAIAVKVLSEPGNIDFILVSFSGFHATPTHATFPYRLAIYAREELPDSLYSRLFIRLGDEGIGRPRIYVICSGSTRQNQVRERAYFLWENKSGRDWRDEVSNWMEAEEQQALCYERLDI